MIKSTCLFILQRSLLTFSLLTFMLLTPSLHAQPLLQSGIANVNGTELYYEMAGAGHPLILLHGGAVDSRAWDDQFDEFSKQFQVIRYDLRGTGQSGDRDKPFSNTEDLRELMRFLAIEHTYLLGISRGGGIAFDFTLDYPDMVKALVLVSSNLGAHVPAYSEMFERTTEVGRQSGPKAAAEVWGNDPHQGPQREAARPKVLQIIEDNVTRFRYLENYRPVEQLSSSDLPRSELLSEIKIPTLIIAGAHDNIVAKANYQNWANGIAEAHMIIFPDSGHLVPIDEPEEFNQTVLEFLNKI